MKPLIYAITFLLMISVASALTVQQLVESYDYNYINGSINVSQYTNGMLDTNSNGKNDKLVFNLTVVPFVTGVYDVVVILSNNQGIWASNTSKTLATTGLVQVNFSTLDINGSVWNYTVRIFDVNNVAVFEKYRQLTNTYATYENGTFIKSVTDSNVNNNSINLTLTLNVSKTETVNITAFLRYNNTDNINNTKNATISAKTETTLTADQEKTVSLLFDNETIKSTHYNGTFILETVKIGEKSISPSYTTAAYNYEDFAKTSYFKAYNHSFTDDNKNGLYEFLNLNLTLNIKQAGTYNISGALYDLFDNQVINFSEKRSLSAGEQKVNITINGSQIYQSYIDGPYIIEYMTLKNSTGNVTDFVSEPYATNSTSYGDYELPKLAELQATISVSVNKTTSQSNITVNVTNLGTASAVGISFDLLDNTSVINKNESITTLEANGSQTFTYSLSNMNSTNITYVAIVDLFDSVDELNDSNNVDTWPGPPTVDTPVFNATTVTKTSGIAANTTYKDDGGSAGTIYFEWFRNSSSIFTENFTSIPINTKVNSTLNTSFYNKGDLLNVTVYANDGSQNSSMNFSTTLTVSNNVPTVETPVFNVSTLTKTSGIKANTTYKDDDGEAGNVSFVWYRNNSIVFTQNFTAISSGTVVNTTLSTTLYNKSDLINVTVVGNDGTINSSKNFSTTLTVANIAPTIETPVFNVSFVTKTSGIAANTTYRDADIDSGNVSFVWYRNNSVVFTQNFTAISSGTIVNTTLNATLYNRSDLINVTVVGNDGVVNSSMNYSTTLTVDNTAPTVETPVFNVISVTKVNGIPANTTYRDADIDSGNVSFVWYRNNSVVFTQNFTAISSGTIVNTTLNATLYNRSDLINVTVVGNDGVVNSSMNFSTTVTVNNSAPSVETPVFNVSTVTKTSGIAANTTYRDTDSDSGNVSFTWYKNNAVILTETFTGATTGRIFNSTLNNTYYGKNDLLNVTVIATDGAENSLMNFSTTMTVANIRPSVETPAFNVTTVTETSGIRANTTYHDADIENGNVSFTWYRNNSVVFTENVTNIMTETISNSSLSNTYYSKGDLLNVTVYATDGVENSSINFSTTLTVDNTAPTIETPIFNVSSVTKASGISANTTYRDVDSDPGNVSFVWYRNNSVVFTQNFTAISSGTIVNTTLNATLYNRSDLINVTVVGNDGVVNSSMNFSTTVTVDNAAPTQDNPIVNSTFGTNLTSENLIVHNISTADADGDRIENVVSWYRNNTPYLLLNANFGGGTNSTSAIDYSGRNNNIQLFNVTYEPNSGPKLDGIVNFTNSGTSAKYVNISGLASFSFNDSYSIEIVYKVYSTAKKILISKKLGSNPVNQTFGISVGNTGIFASISNTTTTQTVSTGINTTNGEWHHFVFVKDNKTNTIYFVLDGGNPAANSSITISNIYDNPSIPVIIGNRFPTGFADQFNGSIASIRIWNDSLSVEQINALYNNLTIINLHQTEIGDTWNASITPDDQNNTGITKFSNNLTIVG